MKKSILLLSLLFNFSLYGFGTYAEGRAIVKVIKLTSGGIIFESYEGTLEIADYDSNESCENFEDCYTPKLKQMDFSVRIENKEVIKFLLDNLNKVILVDYKIHRIEPIALSTGFEILKAYPFKKELEGDFPTKLVVNKTGSTNYSFFGKVLQLEYRGTAIKTYEGIYYDRQKDKIRLFSITNESMANFVKKSMEYTKEYHIGISKAIIKGFRSTPYDIFEINYLERAGGIE
ncbi:MAG: hypothetical protein ACK4UJ_05565 [Leptonema sp. (in: bacteria)]